MSDFLQELWQYGVYKRSQGRITRQVTFAALAITIAIGLWRLSEWYHVAYANGVILFYFLPVSVFWLQYALPGTLLAIGLWLSYRMVNLPGFADFLIGVEAEMNKVSWPSRGELFRASLVVLVSILLLGCILAVFDVVWIWFFSNLLRIY